MHWQKTRLVTHVWTAAEARGFAISLSETPEVEGRPFRRDAPGERPRFFATLKEAQAVASLLNELALLKDDNARLRRELAGVLGGVRSPEAAVRSAAARPGDFADGLADRAKAQAAVA